MDIHKNARLTPKGREEMVRAVVDCGLSKAEAARRYHTTSKTVAKWVERFRKEGVEGLRDRSSKPLAAYGRHAGGGTLGLIFRTDIVVLPVPSRAT